MNPRLPPCAVIFILGGLSACGADEAPPAAPGAEAPTVAEEQAPEEEETNPSGQAPPRGEGSLVFNVSGGIFETPAHFEIRDEALRAMLSGSTFNLMHRRTDNAWLASPGTGVLKQLIFNIRTTPEPGTYDTTQYRLTFVLAANESGDDAKSIVTTGEAGTVTISQRTDDHVIGSFEVQGRATQAQSTEPLYTLEGDFAFARGR